MNEPPKKPSYFILASNYTIDPNTEQLVLDDKLRFCTPEWTPGGLRFVAVFTSLKTAWAFRDSVTTVTGLDAVYLGSGASLRRFLLAARSEYMILTVDLNYQTRVGDPLLIDQVILTLPTED